MQVSIIDRLRSLPKFVPRQILSTFLAKSEFLGVHGDIVEMRCLPGGRAHDLGKSQHHP